MPQDLPKNIAENFQYKEETAFFQDNGIKYDESVYTLTVKEAHEFLINRRHKPISEHGVREACRRGRIDAVKVLGTWVINPASL